MSLVSEISPKKGVFPPRADYPTLLRSLKVRSQLDCLSYNLQLLDRFFELFVKMDPEPYVAWAVLKCHPQTGLILTKRQIFRLAQI